MINLILGTYMFRLVYDIVAITLIPSNHVFMPYDLDALQCFAREILTEIIPLSFHFYNILNTG